MTQETEHDPKEFDPEVVDRAAKYGWTPPDEWKGDPPPNGFMDPEEYLARPKIQLQIRDEEIAELRTNQERVLTETREASENMRRMYEEAAERRKQNHQAEIERLKAEKEAAVESGDIDEYRRVAAQEERLVSQPDPSRKDQGNGSEVQNWAKDKPWFNDDPVARGKAIEIAGLAAKGGADTRGQLEAVDREMPRFMPHLFKADDPEADAKQRHAKVDGGGLAALGGEKKGYDSLPPDAKKQADADIAEGLFGPADDVSSARKRWADAYYGDSK